MRISRTWLERLLWMALGALLVVAGQLFLSRDREAVAVPAASTSSPRDDSPTAAATADGTPECYLGVVVAREAVDVAAEMEGVVDEVRVRLGDRVERGGVIAALDTEPLSHQLAIERANLRNAEAQERRHDIEVSQAIHEHKRRLALVGLLSKEEEEAVIRAPFDGTVAQRYLDPGARVSPGTPVARLLSSDGLLARFAVPPEEAGKVPLATPVRVEVEDLGIALDGVVEHHAPEIDAASQMVFVEARLAAPGEPTPLPSGAVARVSVARAGTSPGSCLGVDSGS